MEARNYKFTSPIPAMFVKQELFHILYVNRAASRMYDSSVN